MELANTVNFSFDDLNDAFPAADPNYIPFGSRVLVQIRLAKKVTRGGIHLIGDARDTETWNTQVAKVLAVGPMAFRNRSTMALWPEGAWAEPGQYVRVPKYGGDRWTAKLPNDDEVMFVAFNDLDLGGLIPDPLKMKAFL